MVSNEGHEIVENAFDYKVPKWELCNRMPFFVILKEILVKGRGGWSL